MFRRLRSQWAQRGLARGRARGGSAPTPSPPPAGQRAGLPRHRPEDRLQTRCERGGEQGDRPREPRAPPVEGSAVTEGNAVVVADRWDGHRYFPALAWRTSDGTAGQATRPASRPGPARVRWPRSRHRRTPGLRREEVAQLAGGRSDLVHVAREQGRDNRAPRRAGMDLTGRGTDLRRPVEPAPGAPDAQPAQMLRPSDRRSPACTSTSPISGSGQYSNIRVTTYTPADAEPRRAQCRGALMTLWR